MVISNHRSYKIKKGAGPGLYFHVCASSPTIAVAPIIVNHKKLSSLSILATSEELNVLSDSELPYWTTYILSYTKCYWIALVTQHVFYNFPSLIMSNNRKEKQLNLKLYD